MEGYGNAPGYGPKSNPGGQFMPPPMVPPVQATRRPLVGEQLDAVMKSAEVLHELLNRAEDRFSPVLRLDPPAGGASPNAPNREHPGVPIAASLMEINARLESACTRLNSLIQRAEC